MSFFTRQPGMFLREARTILSFDESITYCERHGSMTLETYSRVWSNCSANPKTWERHLRRLQRHLQRLGFLLKATSVDGTFEISFLEDEALTATVRRELPEALKILETTGSSSGHFASEQAKDLAWQSIVDDKKNGASTRRLCSRYGIRRDRIRSLLAASGCEPGEPRPLRVEEKRCAAVVKRAIEARRLGAGLRQVGRVLGCSHETARAFLRRFRRELGNGQSSV